MTQDPPQSWPPREPGRSGTRPLAVDPITGELIETDVPPGGEFWVPAADPPQTTAWQPGPPVVEPPPAHTVPGGYPQPPYPPAAYGPPPYGYPRAPGWAPPYAAPRPTNGMAVASLVLGVLWLFWIGSVLALVFGYVARNQMRRTGESGDGLALAGLILGWVGIGTLVLTFLVGALGGSS